MLNNKPLFQFGPLDQGFWPDGLYTAPTDEALRYDIEMTKKLGLQHGPQARQDRAGPLVLLVRQAGPAGLAGHAQRRRHRRQRPDITRGREAGAKQFETELKALIDGRCNHPCIVMWVPFNEGWGQYDTAAHRGPGQAARPDAAWSTTPAAGPTARWAT